MKENDRPDAVRFARRTDWPRAENRLSSLRQELIRRGIRVLDLAESNPTRAGFEGLLQAADLKELAGEKSRSYDPSPAGLLQARQAVADYYASKGIRIGPSQIFLTAGSSEAYSHLFRLLGDPGDKIAVPRPSYPLFDYLASLNDLGTVSYPLLYDQSWHLDLAELEQICLDPLVKGVVLVNPNNPTGSFIRRRELGQLTALLSARKIALISDEVFSDYVLCENGESVASLAANGLNLTFCLGGISKALGLPQMKLGWIAVSGPGSETAEAISRLEIILDTYLSVNTPAQLALPAWLGRAREIQDAILSRLHSNLEFLKKTLPRYPACELLNTEGGWYAILRIPGTQSEEEWALEFLSRDHVYIQPGYFFDFDREAHFVASLLTWKADFEEGIGRLLERVAKTVRGI